MAGKILIVEDEQAMRDALVIAFQSGGYTTITAADGEEGLKTALTERPDLIILDILMPKTDGVAMLAKLREDSWGKEVRVIMLTNIDAGDRMKWEYTRDEKTEYIVKSYVSLDDVVKKAKEMLG